MLVLMYTDQMKEVWFNHSVLCCKIMCNVYVAVACSGAVDVKVMYQTQRECFITFPNTEKRIENKMCSAQSIFDELQGVWKCDGTLF